MCRHYGDKHSTTARVVSIEKCKCGTKEGTPIDEVDFNLRGGNLGEGYEYVFSLDNHRWCYGSQITKTVEG